MERTQFSWHARDGRHRIGSSRVRRIAPAMQSNEPPNVNLPQSPQQPWPAENHSCARGSFQELEISSRPEAQLRILGRPGAPNRASGPAQLTPAHIPTELQRCASRQSSFFSHSAFACAGLSKASPTPRTHNAEFLFQRDLRSACMHRHVQPGSVSL